MRTPPLLLLLTLLAASGCSLFPDEQACTLIGCDDGLMVEVEGAPAGAFTLERLVDGEAAEMFSCPDGSCTLAGFWHTTDEEVTFRLTWAGGVHEETVRPEYQVLRPNGPDCPPVCRQATVRLRVP